MAVTQCEVIVHHRNDMPGGLPAVWVKDVVGDTVIVNLYLRDDLPEMLADGYRVMVTRDVLPEADLEMYAITGARDRVTTMTPSMFA